MQKTISEIVNSSWLKLIQDIDQQTRLAVAFQASDAMRSFRDIGKNLRTVSLGIHESEFGRISRSIAENSRLISSALQESGVFHSIQNSLESNRIALLPLQESEAMKAFSQNAATSQAFARTLQQPSIAKQFQYLESSGWLASIASQQSEMTKQISQFSNLPIFKLLANLKNSPFSTVPPDLLSDKLFPVEIIDEPLSEIESQLSEAMSSGADFDKLPEKTKGILLYLYHYYFLPVILSLICTYIATNASEARKELSSVSTPSEAKAFVRSSSSRFERSALRGFRVTTVGALNLRETPSMKGEIIEKLPVGTLVEVIDKSQRSWLLVEVEIDGEREQGWISRRYTTYFK